MAGGVHFVSLNTETDFPGANEEKTGDMKFFLLPAGHFAPDGAYMRWLEADLAAASKRADIQWIVAGGHRPFASLNETAASALAVLFAKYGVDLYVSGHKHSYKREGNGSWNDGATHITVGGAGCEEMPTPADQPNPPQGQTHLEACMVWCMNPAVRALTPHDPNVCHHCVSPLQNSASAIEFFSDRISIGVLSASPQKLRFELRRAPDGAVLDAIDINPSRPRL